MWVKLQKEQSVIWLNTNNVSAITYVFARGPLLQIQFVDGSTETFEKDEAQAFYEELKKVLGGEENE